MDLVGLLGKEVFLCPLFLVCRSSGVSVCVCVRARARVQSLSRVQLFVIP